MSYGTTPVFSMHMVPASVNFDAGGFLEIKDNFSHKVRLGENCLQLEPGEPVTVLRKEKSDVVLRALFFSWKKFIVVEIDQRVFFLDYEEFNDLLDDSFQKGNAIATF